MKDKLDYSETCPTHGLKGKYIPPPKTDKKRRKLIVTFECPEDHTFEKEFDLK